MLQFLYVIVSTIGLLVLTGGGILAQVEIDSIEQIRSSATQAYRLPGTQKDGQVLLPTQWSLNPAGKHLQVGDFPVTIEMHPLESYAAVLHAGYGDHEIVVIELNDFSIVSRVSLPKPL